MNEKNYLEISVAGRLHNYEFCSDDFIDIEQMLWDAYTIIANNIRNNKPDRAIIWVEDFEGIDSVMQSYCEKLAIEIKFDVEMGMREEAWVEGNIENVCADDLRIFNVHNKRFYCIDFEKNNVIEIK